MQVKGHFAAYVRKHYCELWVRNIKLKVEHNTFWSDKVQNVWILFSQTNVNEHSILHWLFSGMHIFDKVTWVRGNVCRCRILSFRKCWKGGTQTRHFIIIIIKHDAVVVSRCTLRICTYICMCIHIYVRVFKADAILCSDDRYYIQYISWFHRKCDG